MPENTCKLYSGLKLILSEEGLKQRKTYRHSQGGKSRRDNSRADQDFTSDGFRHEKISFVKDTFLSINHKMLFLFCQMNTIVKIYWLPVNFTSFLNAIVIVLEK